MLKLICEKILVFFILFAACGLSPLENEAQNYYWVSFTDKNNSPYSLSAPEEYLSERAILRRTKQNISIDSLDLPVNSEYVRQVLEKGVTLVHASKWFNGVTIKADSVTLADSIQQFPFVKEVKLSKPASANKSSFNKFYIHTNTGDILPIDTTYYGTSALQIGQLNGQFLHDQGYRGEGIHIAVLDAGFLNADSFSAFDSLWFDNRVLGTKDFVDPGSDIYDTHYHGMSVLSCMAGNVSDELIGTSPKAYFWLLRSEDADTEYIIEEDHWVVAAEFADSVGVDIINSSLGYSKFNDATTNHSYDDMDGQTTRVTKAANIAASRGMLVFCSAGNEGNDPWKYIVAPADGEKVIAVGAVDANGVPAFFTSYGPAFGGGVKPNVAAMGRNTYLQTSSGELGFNNGTSFASPIMAGIGACLWQAHPNASAEQIKQAIEQSASLYPDSDLRLGYGIPDMKTADQILKTLFAGEIKNQKEWLVFPNPVQDYLVIQNNDISVLGDEVKITIYTIDGRLFLEEQKTLSNSIILRNLNSFPNGLMILKIESGGSVETIKLSKIR